MSDEKRPKGDDKPRKVVNVTDQAVTFSISVMAGAPVRSYTLQPGDTLDLEPGYALRRQASPDRDLQPSVIEMKTNGMVLPISDPRAKEAVKRREVALAEQTRLMEAGRKALAKGAV